MKKWSVRLGVRTPGFHPGNRGSIPLRTTSNKKQRAVNQIFTAFFVCNVKTILSSLYTN